jgi:hypothetical protein
MTGAWVRAIYTVMLAKCLSYLFHGPAWLTFLAMGVATGGVALCTSNLFMIFRANIGLLATYGAMAVFDGGLRQLLELIFWGYLGVACYLVFKGCMDGLLGRVPPRERA